MMPRASALGRRRPPDGEDQWDDPPEPPVHLGLGRHLEAGVGGQPAHLGGGRPVDPGLRGRRRQAVEPPPPAAVLGWIIPTRAWPPGASTRRNSRHAAGWSKKWKA